MGRVSKKRLAARARVAATKLAQQTAEHKSLPIQVGSEPKWPKEEDSTPMEPTVDIDGVKQEPLDHTANPFDASDLLEEVKVELLEPLEGEPDPIGELPEDSKPVDDMPEISLADLSDGKCQFCLEQFRDPEGRGIITRNRIGFVLGVRKWGASHGQLDCCKGCKKMFDLFYEFKRSCLMALARPLFLMSCGVDKAPSSEVVDLRPRKPVKRRKKQPPSDVKSDDDEARNDPELEESRQESPPAIPPTSSDDDSDIEVVDSVGEASETSLNVPTGNQPVPKIKPTRKTHKYCYRCRKFFESEAVFLEHKPSCIKLGKDPPTVQCSKCPQRFTRADNLTYHMNKHEGIRSVPCRREGCTKKFFNPNMRRNHEMHCGQNVQEICSACGSMFRSKGALRIHMTLHDDPSFVCEVCNKAFHTKQKLKKHSAVHSDERRYQCKVCGKGFKSREANRVHQRIHTQEKPYVCHICGMAFTYNCLLKTHLERGHEPGELALGRNERHELMSATRVMEMTSDVYRML
nr:zinc finger protein 2-like isoform X1 [Aedes albopictus]